MQISHTKYIKILRSLGYGVPVKLIVFQPRLLLALHLAQYAVKKVSYIRWFEA